MSRKGSADQPRPAGDRRRRAERALVERRLIEAGQRIGRARQELAALDEQVAWFADATDDARSRALVTDSAADRRELEEAERHYQAMSRSRADLVEHIERLRRLREELLEELPEPPESPEDADTEERVN